MARSVAPFRVAGSILVTSIRGPDEWLATFADPVRAQSAIDRFTGIAYDLVIEGNPIARGSSHASLRRPGALAMIRPAGHRPQGGAQQGRQGTVQSEHKTVAEAFVAVDSIANDMAQTSVPGDAIELVVADDDGEVIPRPGTH